MRISVFSFKTDESFSSHLFFRPSIFRVSSSSFCKNSRQPPIVPPSFSRPSRRRPPFRWNPTRNGHQLSLLFWKPLPRVGKAARRDGRGDRVVSRGDPRSSGRGPHARCDRGDDRCLPDRAPAAVRVAAWRRNRPRRPRTRRGRCCRRGLVWAAHAPRSASAVSSGLR